MDTPRKFFDAFVKPSYEAWLKAPEDLLSASCAVYQANVMAERMLDFYSKADPAKVWYATKEKPYREMLVAQCPDFKLIWNADNGHKHVHLENVPQRTFMRGPGGIDGMIVSPVAIPGMLGPGVARGPVVIVLEGGKRVPLSSTLQNVIEMWDGLLFASTK